MREGEDRKEELANEENKTFAGGLGTVLAVKQKEIQAMTSKAIMKTIKICRIETCFQAIKTKFIFSPIDQQTRESVCLALAAFGGVQQQGRAAAGGSEVLVQEALARSQ